MLYFSGIFWPNQNIAEGLKDRGSACFIELTISFDDNRCPVH